MLKKTRKAKINGVEILESRVLLSSFHGLGVVTKPGLPDGERPIDVRGSSGTGTPSAKTTMHTQSSASPTVSPESTITIAGQFDPSANARQTIVFAVKGGGRYIESPLQVTPSFLTAAVPVLLKKNGVPTGGVASVSVVQLDSAGITRTRSYKRLHIENLPSSSAPVGSITERFLQSSQSALSSLQAAYHTIDSSIPGTISNILEYTSSGAPGQVTVGAPQGVSIFQLLTTLQQQLGQMSALVSQAAAGGHFSLGTFHGHSAPLTRQSLKLSDRLLAPLMSANTGAMSAEQAVPNAAPGSYVGQIVDSVSRLSAGLAGVTTAAAAALLGSEGSVLALGAPALLNAGLAASAGLVVGLIPLIVVGYLVLSANGDNVIPQLLGQSAITMTDATQNQSAYVQSLGSAQNLMFGFKPSSEGQPLSSVVTTSTDSYESTFGQSDFNSSLGDSYFPNITNVELSIDEKFAQLAQNLGLNPDFGPSLGGGGSGSGFGGSSGSGSGGSTAIYTVVVGGTFGDGEFSGSLNETITVGPTTAANLASFIGTRLTTEFTADAVQDQMAGDVVTPGSRTVTTYNVVQSGDAITGQFVSQGGSGLTAYEYSGGFTAYLASQ